MEPLRLKWAAIPTANPKILSKKETGLDASRWTGSAGEEWGKCFFLTSSFIG